jgi:YidC/Oxa1 family membrane protein insertase
MGATYFMLQKLSPPPPDPTQARIMSLLPLIMTISLAQVQAGLLIYWSWNNLLSITQQTLIMYRMGVPIKWGGTPPTPKT